MKFIRHFLVFLASLTVTTASAQDDSTYVLRADAHFGISYARAIGAYKDFNADDDAIGLRVAVAYQVFEDIPVMFGVDLSYHFINSRKSEYITQDEFGDDFLVRDRWTNNRFAGTFRVNYHLFKWGRIVPFIESGVGLQYISTFSSWTDLDGDRVFEVITVEDDAAWLTYVAAGIEYEIDMEVGAYFRIENTWSGSLDYFALRGSKIDSEFNDRHFSYLESSLDLLTFEVGIFTRF